GATDTAARVHEPAALGCQRAAMEVMGLVAAERQDAPALLPDDGPDADSEIAAHAASSCATAHDRIARASAALSLSGVKPSSFTRAMTSAFLALPDPVKCFFTVMVCAGIGTMLCASAHTSMWPQN